MPQFNIQFQQNFVSPIVEQKFLEYLPNIKKYSALHALKFNMHVSAGKL